MEMTLKSDLDYNVLICWCVVPRNHANKNTSYKNNGFTLFWAIKGIENTTKNAIQIPWGW